VKNLRKSVNICQSYHKNKRDSFFMAHSVRSANPLLEEGTERQQENKVKYVHVR